MIIVDTNVLSELMKHNPDQAVITWADNQASQAITTTSITSAEIYAGLGALPDGKRKKELLAAFADILSEMIDVVLPFDQAAAECYGALTARLRSDGKTIGQSDSMIAAIALIHDGTVVTRNTRHFEHCNIELANPFEGDYR